MMTYLKNTGRFTHAQLKHRDFEEIQGLYNKEKELVDTFVPIGSEEDERRIKDLNTKAEEESSNKDVDSTNKRKKRIRMKRSSKKQKTDADLKEEEQLKTFLSIVPNEEEAIDYEVLDKRYQIVDWKSEFYHNDRYGEPHDYYRVFRADGSSRYIKTFTEMVSRFDRMDFLELHSLVMQRFETTTPEGIDLILWGDLKTMFEANAVDELWKNQEDWILKSWNLYENCGVHILMLEDGTEFHMLAERKYPLTKETLEKMLVLRLTAESESEAAFDLLRLVLLVEDFAAAEVLKNLLQVVSAVRVNINTVFEACTDDRDNDLGKQIWKERHLAADHGTSTARHGLLRPLATDEGSSVAARGLLRSLAAGRGSPTAGDIAHVEENNKGYIGIDFGDDIEHIDGFSEADSEVMNLMVQRTLCSTKFEDFSQRNKIFESKCLVENNICSLIIDGGCCENIVQRVSEGFEFMTTVDVSTDAPNTFGMSNDPTGIPTVNMRPISYINIVNYKPTCPVKNGDEQVSNEPLMNEVPASYANKFSPTSLTKANLRKLDAIVPNDADYNVWLPLALVHEVND
ncbi:hypothetical protein Tco_0924644 [Tanacetum coccineum]|uniref:Uncharacterized protein n=1 Tax=Tanacetum coccineum TaxID=301880 RepID=A0ABQ5D5W9_9ASTR